MFPKQSKPSVQSSRRVGGFERSEKPPTRRPARDRSRLGPQPTVAKQDPRRLPGSQSEQSLGPPPVAPPAAPAAVQRRVAAVVVAARTKRASPHLQDRNLSMDESPTQSSSCSPSPSSTNAV